MIELYLVLARQKDPRDGGREKKGTQDKRYKTLLLFFQKEKRKMK